MQVLQIEDIQQISGGFKYRDTNFGSGGLSGLSGVARGAQVTAVGRAVTFSFSTGYAIGTALNGAFGISDRIGRLLSK